MSDLFALAMPWWEFMLRAVAVYFMLLAMLRLSGKRTVGQFTPFDLLVVVLLGSAVQNALLGEDSSLLGGLLLAATLVACNWVVGFVTARSRRVEKLVEGSPVLLARDGVMFEPVLRAQNISRKDLEEALRDSGLPDVSGAALVTLEVDGTITVVPRKDDSR
ncbi:MULTISPECIES: YetF domain-containing protein [unclassified Luteimonas]|uniref:DUF421 domain-containing protein n=1 Tax=unclassified Luteimonas TaxID=2629088 RepID=UPI0018F0F9E1|nr:MULTISPECIES: YetF domain-containing protein [unclassified Luteimonas]MBJ6981741.1 DUF421 domain-containing protein [Luteimonas sp. MC1572]MBJ7575716.1 DUF421 domain-containing protein [Luteimonas sp. MC1828]QQO03029.1 DUF421 domain-containing protein [Luteimonas sp. MC1572]